MSSRQTPPDDPEGFGDAVARFIHHVPVEQRLAGIPVEQRLAGLSPDQAVLALPDEVLRALEQGFLSTLSDETREAIRRRVGR